MILIKAKQQNVSFEKDVEKLAFVLSARLYNTLEADKVIDEAAKRSGISAGVIKAAWDADPLPQGSRFNLHPQDRHPVDATHNHQDKRG